MVLGDLIVVPGLHDQPTGELVLTSTCEVLGTGEVTTIVVTNDSADEIVLRCVQGSVALEASQVLEHGWQSWSTVRRTDVRDIRPVRASAPRWFTNVMLIDRSSAGVTIAGDTFLVTNAGVIGALSSSNYFVTFSVSTDGAIGVVIDLDGIVIEGGTSMSLEAIWCSLGDPGERYSEYAELCGARNGARVTSRSPMAWCSWYQYFGGVLPEHLEGPRARAAELGIEVIQIDDGWQREIGDWLHTSPGWGPSMEIHATALSHANCQAGLWTAPFLAIEGGWIDNEHPEWLVRHDDGRAVTALIHEGWGGRVFALDTTNPHVIDHLVSTYQQLRRQGFSYHKIDFCFAAGIPGTRFGSGQLTRAQALRAGLEAVRRGIGDDAFLVGCGCPLLSAVGIVDAMRVSEDVAPYWEPREHIEGFEESSVSTRNALEQSALRAPLHRRWFINDCDCVLARPSDTELDENDRTTFATAVAGLGGFVVLSDDISRYDDDTLATVTWLRDTRHVGDSPLDLVDPFATPVVVRSAHTTLALDWDRRTSAIHFE